MHGDGHYSIQATRNSSNFLFFEKHIKYLNVISTKKMLVAFESFMEVAQSNMDIAKALLHHGYIDVSGCCIWV
jgi:hypothetical protein